MSGPAEGRARCQARQAGSHDGNTHVPSPQRQPDLISPRSQDEAGGEREQDPDRRRAEQLEPAWPAPPAPSPAAAPGRAARCDQGRSQQQRYARQPYVGVGRQAQPRPTLPDVAGYPGRSAGRRRRGILQAPGGARSIPRPCPPCPRTCGPPALSEDLRPASPVRGPAARQPCPRTCGLGSGAECGVKPACPSEVDGIAARRWLPRARRPSRARLPAAGPPRGRAASQPRNATTSATITPRLANSHVPVLPPRPNGPSRYPCQDSQPA